MQRKTKRPSAATKPKPAELDRDRDRYLSLIRQFRLMTGANAFADKAHRLLTTHWARSTWASRAEILKSADWLLRIASCSPDPHRTGTPAE